MDKKQCNSCGKPKCSCKNKEFTKAVIEIDNPEQITLMRRVVIPASMGDDTAVPPVVGKYHNVLLYYEANHKSYLYSSDGIPTLLANGLTDYEEAVNLPQINGHTLLGDQTGPELGLQNEISHLEQYARYFDTVADMKAATNLKAGDYARTLGYYNRNSKGGAFYKIRTIANDDVVDEKKIIALSDNALIAELITTLGLSPEQLGSKSDGTHDDSVEIQMCVNESKNTGVRIIFEKSLYYVSHGIDMPQEFSIDFQGITLCAISGSVFAKGMVNCESTWNIHNGVISNLKLDQNNTASKGIYVNRSWRRTYENIDIKNTPTNGYGIYLDGSNGSAGGNQFNNITGTGNYLNSTFIYVGVNDCVFSHVDYQQYTVGIETNRFVRLYDIHGYIGNDPESPEDWYTGSVFIKIDPSGRLLADDLYPDTHNYCFYNNSNLSSSIGKIFFTFNETTSQSGNKSVMFKAHNDVPDVYYRWRVNNINLAISNNVLFEIIKDYETGLNSSLHILSITGGNGINYSIPPVYVSRSLPANNYSKLGVYGDNLVATGTCQYAARTAEREVCQLTYSSGTLLMNGYYPFKGIADDGTTIYDGTVKVENNTVIILPNINQGIDFQFFITLPVEKAVRSAS